MISEIDCYWHIFSKPGHIQEPWDTLVTNDTAKKKALLCHCEPMTHWKRPWCWERLKAGEGDNRGWDGWIASPTQWTWVWARSESGWWTGKPGMLWSMGSQRVGHNWGTELNWTNDQQRRKWITAQTLESWCPHGLWNLNFLMYKRGVKTKNHLTLTIKWIKILKSFSRMPDEAYRGQLIKLLLSSESASLSSSASSDSVLLWRMVGLGIPFAYRYTYFVWFAKQLGSIF